jgi:hypothetical protein
MNYRLATILARETHSADTTKVIDLNLKDPVSQIFIIYEGLQGSEGTPTGHPAKCITKIELVDGSDVLYSLSGVETQAVDFYHRKKEAGSVVWYLNGWYAEQVYIMNFGRFPFDPMFAWDPSKFKNPQLKISIDIDGGGCAPSAGYLGVVAKIFDEKMITPAGFLMHKEIKDYTFGAGTHEYTDLPVDFPYRKLFLRGYKEHAGTEFVWDTIKLSEDNDRRLPINNTGLEILKAMLSDTPPFNEHIYLHGYTAGRDYFCTPHFWTLFSGAGFVDSATINGCNVVDGVGGRFKFYSTTSGLNHQLHVSGFCPHGVIELPFGDQNEPEDWYDVSGIGSLTLDVKSGSTMTSSQSCQVFMQQLRKY